MSNWKVMFFLWILNECFSVTNEFGNNFPVSSRLKQIEEIKNNANTNETRDSNASDDILFQNKHIIELVDFFLHSQNSNWNYVHDYYFNFRKYGSSVGRYVVAGETIKKNQPIYRERAFVFVPVYNDYDSDTIFYHCQNCAKTNCIPFPCYDCSRASYCNSACLELHKNIHRYECAGYRKNLWMKIGIAHLAFRNFIVGFFESFQVTDELDIGTPDEVLDQLTQSKRSDFVYKDVLRLVTNFDKMDTSDCLRYALTAQMLTVYLDEFTDFFENLPKNCARLMPNVGDWKKFCAALLMRHMGQLVIAPEY